MEQERIENESAEIMLPGFRFHPTDEELVGFYLRRKVQHKPLSIELIKQLDIYKYDPWDLPKMATTGEKEWYFYCPRDRKYRNSNRPNRVTGAGFWKATGTDRPVYSSDGSRCIGLKKSLVFYRGRASRGTKTDWMMHEFRLPSASPKKYLDKIIPANEAWAICRIFKKASTNAHRALSLTHQTWISPVISDSGGADASDHTMNPSVVNLGSVSCSYTTAATSNTTNAPLQLGFCSDLQQPSPMAVAAATTLSLLNSQWPSSIGIQPLAVDDASSSLLPDMSSSVLQGGVGGFRASAAEPCDGLISAVGAAETMISAVNWDQEWGVVRFPNYSNLVWDYSSPCPSELSTAYSTSNCYT